MVKLLIGHKGTGKTKRMIELANDQIENSKGSVIFINKNSRLMYDLKYRIRVIYVWKTLSMLPTAMNT